MAMSNHLDDNECSLEPNSQCGVYFSSNDMVLDWAVAFLSSFRRFNPDLHLRWIPFGDNVDKTRKLIDNFGVHVHESSDYSQLEEIGKKLELGYSVVGPFWFRRYAAFSGPLSKFLYLDCRFLVLTDLRPMIEAPGRFGLDLVHYDCALDQVYSAGRLRRQFAREQLTRGFLSGAWASSQGVFSIRELIQYGSECEELRDQLNARNTDQSFINYCCNKKRVKIGHFAELIGDMCQDAWSRQPGYVYRAPDGYRRWDFGGLNHKKRVPLLHWAGTRLSHAMPEAELFYSFRDAEFGWLKRSIRKVGRAIVRPVLKLANALRANRWLNQTYHRIRRKQRTD
jgi:hypothetical protein